MVREVGLRTLGGSVALGLLAATILVITSCVGSTPASPQPATNAESFPPSAGASQAITGHSIAFEHISVEQGLSQATVYAILQDSLGFMWFGTLDGLDKYDGYQFTVYRHDPQDSHSLSSNTIHALYEDSTGALWIGTRNGLNRLALSDVEGFDRETENAHGEGAFTRYQHRPDDPSSLSDDYVYTVYEDGLGTLWVGTRNGLNRLDRRMEDALEEGTFTRYHHRPEDPHSLSDDVVFSIHEDSAGVLWIGTQNGLNRFDRETETFVRYHHWPEDPNSLSNDAVHSLREDGTGAFWIGTENGLSHFDRTTEAFTRYPHDPDDPSGLSHDVAHSMCVDTAGTLWIGTWGGGLNRFEEATEDAPGEGAFTRYQHDPDDPGSLSGDIVLSIYQDAAGGLWVGTIEGLDHFDPTRKKFGSYQHDVPNPNSLSSDAVNAMCRDSAGGLWIGTVDGGLDYLDRATGTYAHYRHDPADPTGLSSDSVMSVYLDGTGVLWVGTDNGLSRFDRATDTFVHYQHRPDDPNSLSDNRVVRIMEDGTGALWVGTYAGLDRFDRETETFTRYQHRPDDPGSLSDHPIVSIYQDRAGVLWVGAWGGGLNRFDRVTETFSHYQHQPDDPHSLSDDNVFAIYEDSSGVLWVGTQGGLNRFDREAGQFRVYRQGDGLPNDVVLGILEDGSGGHLWLSTGKGLSRFDPRTETFRNYNTGDGLASDEFNIGVCCKSDSGEMFFGGPGGVTAFHPGEIKDNPYVPPILITDFQLFNQSVPISPDSPLKQHINVTTDLVLTYRDSVFSFEYAALNYTSPEKNQYAYMMEGVDRDWNYVGDRRFATYTTLPPGRYVFRVKGSNNDGVWNETGTSVRITITPPWWQTGWAYGLYVLAAVGTVAGYVRYRTRSQARAVARLEAEVAERTAALRQLNEELEGRVAERTQHLRLLTTRLAEVEEAERQGLARELHDQVGQSLVSLGLHLKMVRTQMPTCTDHSQETLAGQLYTHLDDALALVKETTRRIRNVMDELRPPVLEEYGLLAALRWYGDKFAGRANPAIAVLGDGPSPRLPLSVETALFRVAQEALTNVARHAEASRVTVTVEASQGIVRMVVADDGAGFDPRRRADPADRQRWGLLIMAERAEAVGGRCWVESSPGEGTRVIVEVPRE
jgi:two-component system sensor histidine kinase ChiS